MIKSLRIQNFKSIVDDTIELGKINVFIGENGCGKSNILEAMAMMSASFDNSLDNEGLYSKGVRVAKPTLMRNEFLSGKKKDTIQINCTIAINNTDYPIGSTITAKEENSVFADWNSENDILALMATPTGRSETQVFHEFVKLFSTLDDREQYKIIKGVDKELQKQSPMGTKELEEKILDKRFKIWVSNAFLSSTVTSDTSILREYLIYNLSTKALRGIYSESQKTPLGVNGENLHILVSTFDKNDLNKLKDALKVISWFSDIIIDLEDILKFAGHKLGKSTSTLYFKDKFMKRKNNIFSAENANEGILHILFYLALFISKRTPKFFAIDNIETALNPQLCRNLLKTLAELAKEHDKQALITTHNPAVLDGLNLHDEDQRLFVVYRNDKGHTQTKRISVKPDFDHNRYKLSELWMRGQLGGIPQTF